MVKDHCQFAINLTTEKLFPKALDQQPLPYIHCCYL